LEQAANEARRIMENLRPSVLDSFGLRSALEDSLRRAAEYSEPPLLPRLHIEVTEAELDRLCEEEQLALYRIVQEALTNASRHAHATTLTLRMCRSGDELLVQVIDDGVCLPETGAGARARGMENMRFRARLIRAALEWRVNQARGGTTVELRLGLHGE
ncbi:MAG TPA: ATP-binding protein, partial [Pyrinomonadaceae bacterium]